MASPTIPVVNAVPYNPPIYEPPTSEEELQQWTKDELIAEILKFNRIKNSMQAKYEEHLNELKTWMRIHAGYAESVWEHWEFKAMLGICVAMTLINFIHTGWFVKFF
jgi:hypothetical protein